MSETITLSELREMSASAIQALPRATHILNGDDTVGILIPVRKPSPAEAAAAFAKVDAAAARRTPEEKKELEVLLGDALEPD
jgi:hypothetical protein